MTVRVIVIGRIKIKFLPITLAISYAFFLLRRKNCLECLGAYNAGGHLFSFRTQKLSPVVPMVVLLVSARVGRCQDFRDNISQKFSRNGVFLLLFYFNLTFIE